MAQTDTSPQGKYAVWVGVAGVLVTLLIGLARTKLIAAGGGYSGPSWMLVVPGVLGAGALAWGYYVVTRLLSGREMGAAAIGLGTFVLVGTLAQVAVALFA